MRAAATGHVQHQTYWSERGPHRVQTLPCRPQKLKLVSALTPRSGCAASRAEHAAASALQQPATICVPVRRALRV